MDNSKTMFIGENWYYWNNEKNNGCLNLINLKKLINMPKTKKVTITLTEEQQEQARKQSKVLFGKENISGYVGYLIEKART